MVKYQSTNCGFLLCYSLSWIPNKLMEKKNNNEGETAGFSFCSSEEQTNLYIHTRYLFLCVALELWKFRAACLSTTENDQRRGDIAYGSSSSGENLLKYLGV